MTTEVRATTPPQENNIKGKVDINLEVGIKGLVLIGATVYVAAKAGARKAVRRELRRGNGGGVNPVVLFQQVKDVLKEEGPAAAAQAGAATVWGETTDKVEQSDHQGPGATPSVDFTVPNQATTSPGDEPTPPAGVGG